MSTDSECHRESEEEEEMVRRVGGRGRSLVQALIRIRRERAGRAPQNLQVTRDNRTRTKQEVCPCSQEVRLGGLEARGMRNWVIDDGPWTDDMYDNDRPRSRVRARARPSTPFLHPGFLMTVILHLWGTLWLPTDVSIVIVFQLTFSLATLF